MIRPVSTGPVDAKGDMEERTILGIGDQGAWQTREKDDWRAVYSSCSATWPTSQLQLILEFYRNTVIYFLLVPSK
jgi:hypothetical protein